MKNQIKLLLGLMIISLSSYGQVLNLGNLKDSDIDYGTDREIKFPNSSNLTKCVIKAKKIEFSADIVIYNTKIECDNLEFNGTNINFENCTISCNKITFNTPINNITLKGNNTVICKDLVIPSNINNIIISKNMADLSKSSLFIKYSNTLSVSRAIKISDSNNLDFQIIKE